MIYRLLAQTQTQKEIHTHTHTHMLLACYRPEIYGHYPEISNISDQLGLTIIKNYANINSPDKHTCLIILS